MAKTQTTKLLSIKQKTYIDTDTGEVIPGSESILEERDFNFHKIWMRDFISKMELVGNQKTKIAYWIINNLNKENQLNYTYRQISIGTDTSLETVRSTMSILLQQNFLRKQHNGCYVINPDIIFKGAKKARMGVFNIYQDTEYKAPSLDEQIIAIEKSINDFQQKLKKLYYQKEKQLKNITPEIKQPEQLESSKNEPGKI